MKSLIIAREKEQAMLDRLLMEPTSQLLTVYGRMKQNGVFDQDSFVDYFEEG